LPAGIYSIGRELFFPSFCYLCKAAAEPGQPLCQNCLSKIEFIAGARCLICGELFLGQAISHICGDCAREKPHFEKARAWVKFQEPAVQIAHMFKYSRAFHFLDWMAVGMIDVFQKEFAGESFDFIIPVSLHWLRLVQRGYNQALILAKPLSRKLKIPIRAGALVRIRNNPPQVGLSRNQRKENIKKVFRLKNSKLVQGRNILLVDDVITTGATVDEAAKVLRKAGADKVSVLAFARA